MRSLVLIISLLFAFASTQGQGAMFLRGSQPAPTPGAGLLDSYKGSAFAMAPDVLLYSTYSALDDIAGSETFGQSGQWSVAILRDSDNAIRSFTPGQVADGTANTWVQAAGAANGLVRRAYDQSVTALDVSNLNHANQTTTANMPKLFDSSTGLIVENGRAAMEGRSVSTIIVTNININTNYSFFSVNKENGPPYQSYHNIFSYGEIQTYSTGTNYQIFSGSDFDTGLTFEEQAITSNIVINNTMEFFKNGQSGGTKTVTKINNDLELMGFNLIPRAMNGKMQLFIAFPSSQSTNRPGIETAINNEYNIY